MLRMTSTTRIGRLETAVRRRCRDRSVKQSSFFLSRTMDAKTRERSSCIPRDEIAVLPHHHPPPPPPHAHRPRLAVELVPAQIELPEVRELRQFVRQIDQPVAAEVEELERVHLQDHGREGG